MSLDRSASSEERLDGTVDPRRSTASSTRRASARWRSSCGGSSRTTRCGWWSTSSRSPISTAPASTCCSRSAASSRARQPQLHLVIVPGSPIERTLADRRGGPGVPGARDAATTALGGGLADLRAREPRAEGRDLRDGGADVGAAVALDLALEVGDVGRDRVGAPGDGGGALSARESRWVRISVVVMAIGKLRNAAGRAAGGPASVLEGRPPHSRGAAGPTR